MVDIVKEDIRKIYSLNNTNLSAEEVAKQIQEKMKTIEKGQTHV